MSSILKAFFVSFLSFINPSTQEIEEFYMNKSSYEFCVTKEGDKEEDKEEDNEEDNEKDNENAPNDVTKENLVTSKMLKKYIANGGSVDLLNAAITILEKTQDKRIYSEKRILEHSGESLVLNLYDKSSREFRSYWFNFEMDSLIILTVGAGTGIGKVKNSLEGKTTLGNDINSHFTPMGCFIADIDKCRYSKPVGAEGIPLYGINKSITIENAKHQITRLPSNYNTLSRGILLHRSKNNKDCPLNTSQGCLTYRESDYKRFKKFFKNNGGEVLIINYSDRFYARGNIYSAEHTKIGFDLVDTGSLILDL